MTRKDPPLGKGSLAQQIPLGHILIHPEPGGNLAVFPRFTEIVGMVVPEIPDHGIRPPLGADPEGF